MLTSAMFAAIERHVGEGNILAVAHADFGNGYELIYGMTSAADDSGQFVPFSMRVGREDFHLWPDRQGDDMGVAPMAALIDHLMNEEGDDPHE
jgi:hypothetical protein